MMLIINMSVSALAIAIMLTSTSDAVIWSGVVIFGLGMASTYPTVLTLVEKYVNLSGKVQHRAPHRARGALLVAGHPPRDATGRGGA